jgi:hypothetical protein
MGVEFSQSVLDCIATKLGITVKAAHATQLPVELDDLVTSSALVQTINVLGDEGVDVTGALELA